MVYHPDFVSTTAAEENVFISNKHRELADALVQDGYMTQNTCMDYANGLRKTSYKVEISTAVVGGDLSCGSWNMAVVGAKEGQANLLLIVLNSNGCITGTKARNTQCVPCTEANCKNSNHLIPSSTSLVCQPCRCHQKYNSCSLSYKVSGHDAVDACPASPPPQTTAVCPSLPDDKLRSALEASHPGYCWLEMEKGNRVSKSEWPDNTDLIFTANLGRTIITAPKSLLSSVDEDGYPDWEAPADGIAMVECKEFWHWSEITTMEVGEIAGIAACLILIICLLVACCRKKRAPAAQGVQLQGRAYEQTPVRRALPLTQVYGIAPANLDKKAGPLKQGSVVNFEGAEWVVQYINSKGMLDLKHVTSSSVAYEQTPAAYGQPALAAPYAAQIVRAEPPAPPAGDPMQKLTQLTAMKDAGLITEEEYAKKKNDILSRYSDDGV
jgi:hypothetical protein